VSRFVADFVGSSNVLAPDFVYWIVGEKRWASLRPEAIHVMAAGTGASRMTGTIVTRSYLGPVVRLLIDLNGTKLHAAVPSSESVPGEGARVTLGFAKDAIHLMEGEA
jgi:putative spermidine/putrescine transport system ATP-binding protein